MSENKSRRGACSRPGCAKASVARRLCRAHYQQAWKAGDFANAPREPRPVDRKVCPADHKHEQSSTCYIQHQCRCEPCWDATTARAKARRKEQAYGRFDTGLVPTEPVREHMMVLAEFGIGYKRAARLAGVGVTAARNILWGRQEPGPRYGELPKRTKRETAEALLSVQPTIENLADGASVPATATHRRLQALVAIGWSVSALGGLLGRSPANMHTTLTRQTMVSARFHREVAALYEQMWDTPPSRADRRAKASYSRAIQYAKERRWLPPLAWDDIETDAEPPVVEGESDGIDHVAVTLACAGERVRLSSAERRVAVTELHRSRLSDSAIAERLWITPRSVLRIRQELELPAAVDASGTPVSGQSEAA